MCEGREQKGYLRRAKEMEYSSFPFLPFQSTIKISEMQGVSEGSLSNSHFIREETEARGEVCCSTPRGGNSGQSFWKYCPRHCLLDVLPMTQKSSSTPKFSSSSPTPKIPLHFLFFKASVPMRSSASPGRDHFPCQ